MAIMEKEQILFVAAENIPNELKQLKQWVVWKAVENKERKQFDKIPFQANGVFRASSTDSSTWCSFDEAYEAYECGVGEGIGFVLTESDPYSCIDIDGIEDVENLPQLASEIVNLSYAELSPSAKGIHVWIKGFKHDSEKYKNKNTNLGFEIYDNKRFITFTGESLNELSISGSNEITRFIDKVFKRKENLMVNYPQNQQNYGVTPLPESEIIRIAIQSKKGERFSKFLFGGWEVDYGGDYSDADMAFLNDLAFWCNRDPKMMDSIYRKSTLMRDKWDRQQNGTTYGWEHIYKAISECSNTFTPTIQKDVEFIEKSKSWWATNANGTKTLLHKLLAEEIINEFSIVRHPSPHSSLYYYNKNKGIYEEDKSGRQISAIIRTKDDLKKSQIREVQEYIQDMSPIVRKINNDYIAVENGLINLKTFELESFSPRIFLIQKIPTNYNPNAYDDFIHQTLEKVTDGHEPSIYNIHEMFACVLYPEILVPKMFYLYGPRAHNGKSSVLNMIYETFDKNGGNISAVSPQKLAINTFAGSSIYGKLANIVDDQPDQPIEDSGLLKTIITGGRGEIEKKGRDSETVKFSTVCITASNFFPNFKENGKQINRRLHILPFEHDFSSDPECISDSESMRRIASDSAREYVLKLAVDALKRMLANPNSDKLTPNNRAEKIGQRFAEQNDPLGDYFSEFDIQYFEEMQGTRVIQEYEEWCKDNHVQPLDVKRFKEEVCNRFNMEWKTKNVKINGSWKPMKGFKLKSN